MGIVVDLDITIDFGDDFGNPLGGGFSDDQSTSLPMLDVESDGSDVPAYAPPLAEEEPADAAGRIDWTLVAVRIAGAALVVPVMEELFWRSFLLRWLHDRQFLKVYPNQVGFAALAISSVLFGVEHNQWFAGVVAGLGYGLLYMRTGNLWAPILAHAVTNGLLGAWIVGTGAWTYW